MTAERFDIVGALGGRLGMVEAVLPSVVFVMVYGIVRDLQPALVASLVPAAAFTVWRLLRRQSMTQALGGLLGVGVCAFVASRTGQAEDFFLPSILKNVGYAAAYVVTGLVRWPLLGLFLGPLLGEGLAWRHDPARLRVYTRAGWIWAGMFLLRVAYQVPLYLLGAVTALGVLSVPMGLPLFALTCWVTWRMLRQVPVTQPHGTAGEEPDERARTTAGAGAGRASAEAGTGGATADKTVEESAEETAGEPSAR